MDTAGTSRARMNALSGRQCGTGIVVFGCPHSRLAIVGCRLREDDERKGGNSRDGEQGRYFASGTSANMPVHARLLESQHPLLLAS